MHLVQGVKPFSRVKMKPKKMKKFTRTLVGLNGRGLAAGRLKRKKRGGNVVASGIRARGIKASGIGASGVEAGRIRRGRGRGRARGIGARGIGASGIGAGGIGASGIRRRRPSRRLFFNGSSMAKRKAGGLQL
jgi:hypothetical protein